jgi:hypothetical protein
MLEINGEIRYWRQLGVDEYAALYPANPKALRKIARMLRKLGKGSEPFTMAEWKMAKLAGVSKRTLQRYLPVFQRYGIIEVHHWRYLDFGTTPNTYRLYFGRVIPEDWRDGGGEYPVSSRKTV